MKNLFLLITILLSASSSLAQQKQNIPVSEICLLETSPRYPGGEEDMKYFIESHTYYPVTASRENVEGSVRLQFVIAEDGTVKDVKVTESLHPDCDSIAVGIIRSMPKWEAGKQNGKPVAVAYTLLVHFPKEKPVPMIDVVYALPDNLTVPFGLSIERPSFVGGESAMNQYIRENLSWNGSTENFPQGKFIIQFIVDEQGKVHNPAIVRGFSPEFDEMALKMFRDMPDWEKTGDGSRKVNHLITLPIHIRFP